MDVLNKERTDFSDAYMLQLAIMLECVYAAELIAYRVSATLDAHHVADSLFQRRKQCLNRGRRKVEEIIRDFEVAFDTAFTNVICKSNDRYGQPDLVQQLANDALRLLLIYYARSAGEVERGRAMQKALLNFKPIPGLDIEELLKYYNLKD